MRSSNLAVGVHFVTTSFCESTLHRNSTVGGNSSGGSSSQVLRGSHGASCAEELLLVDLTVTITVGLVDHLLKLLVGHVLAELLGHALEVLERDLASLIVVEETEHLNDLLAGVTVAHA